MKYGDLNAVDQKSKAELFNSYFESVFFKSDHTFDVTDLDVPQFSDKVMQNVEISTEQVYDVLSNINVKKAQGADNISNHV